MSDGQTQQEARRSIQRPEPDYGGLLTGISDLLDQARRMSARTVNNILTATYWEIGRRIVEYEQGGKARAEYGETDSLKRLAQDLTARYGRGFSVQGLYQNAWRSTWGGRFARHRLANSRPERSCPQIWGRLRHFPDTVGRIGGQEEIRRRRRRESAPAGTLASRDVLRNWPNPFPSRSRSPGPTTSG